MNGASALLTDRMASLLPKTTAGACYAESPWSSTRGGQYGCEYCSSTRRCYTSCHGAAVCGAWTRTGCYQTC
jgi:hypothetical protein